MTDLERYSYCVANKLCWRCRAPGCIKPLCFWCRALTNKRFRDLRRERSEQGLCLTCAKAARPGKTRCLACAMREKELRDRRKEQRNGP